MSMRKDAHRLEEFAVSTMDSNQRLIQVIRAMRSEIRKLELENMGLKRRAGANLRKNATVPMMTTGCRGKLINLLFLVLCTDKVPSNSVKAEETCIICLEIYSLNHTCAYTIFNFVFNNVTVV